MEPIYLLDLASRRASWLAARQATLAGNIANANTPGYKAKDLANFSDVLNKTSLDLVSTNTAHLATGGIAEGTTQAKTDTASGFEVTESGNTVGLEQELIKAGDVNREYSMTTSIMKSFHAMLMASLKE